MFLAVGSGAYVAAIFHMITHAFFKALLFLGSGSVIHGMDDEQDMRRMGGLRKLMPITAVTFIVGWLAIAGVPPVRRLLVEGRDPAVRLEQGRHRLPALGRRPGHRRADRLLHEPPGVPDLLRRAPLGDRGAGHEGGEAEQSADAVGAEETGAGSAAVDVADAGHGHGEAIHPHESPWTMTCPLVVLAGLSSWAGR